MKRVGFELYALFMNFMLIFAVETAAAGLVCLTIAGADPTSPLVPALWGQLAFFVIPLIFWQVRTRAPKFWMFLLGHLLPDMVFVFLVGRNLPQRIFYGIFCFAFTVMSLYQRLGEKDEFAPEKEEEFIGVAAAGGILAVTILVCIKTEYYVGVERLRYVAIALVFFYFINLYLDNLKRFMVVNHSTGKHIPVKSMLLQGGGFALVFAFASAIFLGAISDAQSLQVLGERIGDAILTVVRLIIQGIGWFMSLFQGEGGDSSMMGQMPGEMDMGAAAVEEAPMWLYILVQAVQWTITAVVVVAISYMLYRAIQELIRRFYEQGEHKVDDTTEAVEIRERIRSSGTRQSRTLGLFRTKTPEEKIRGSYAAFLLRAAGARVGVKGAARNDVLQERSSCTARELSAWAAGIEEKSAEPQTEELRRLTALYEKARYMEGCTQQEVKEAKQLSDRLRRAGAAGADRM